MTRDETLKILMTIQAAYPSYKVTDKTVTANLWFRMLKDYTYIQVEAALDTYIRTNKSGFAPSIGEIIDILHMLFGEEDANEAEAWELVWKAVKNSIYHAEEEFNKLPVAIQKAAVSPARLKELAVSQMDDISIGVERSNFMRTYRSELAKQKEIRKMSPEVRALAGKSWRAVEEKAGAAPQIESKEDNTHQEVAFGVPERLREKYLKLFEKRSDGNDQR